jgi:hypothetical protein
MPRRRGPFGAKGPIALMLALYVMVLVVTPVLHHDLACHRTSPTHCTACTGSPAASRVEPRPGLQPSRLPEAGRVESLQQEPTDAAALLYVSGRSPPA